MEDDGLVEKQLAAARGVCSRAHYRNREKNRMLEKTDEGGIYSVQGAREDFIEEVTCSLGLKRSKESERGSRQKEQQIQGGTKGHCEFQTRGENFQHA